LEEDDELQIELKVVPLTGGLMMLEGIAFGSGITKSLNGVVARSMLTS